ncbi:hypothetical protein EBB07_17405 [Paenibacillaceae bacterium]|nr:hypothetical protein EBB07_17405 [Paenibacillaceae bacterium]
MSHIINAEAEKMQAFVQYAQHSMNIKTKNFIQFNNSVSKLLEEITMEQWLGLNKLDRITQLIENHYGSKSDCLEDNFEEDEFCHEE